LYQKPAEYKEKYGFEVIGNPEISFEEIVLDSREAGFKKAFIAIKGSRADGHNFIDEAYGKGARVFFIDSARADEFKERYKNKLIGVSFLFIPGKDSVASIEQAAAKKADELSGEIIGITGSSGKTTVKDMIHSLLSTKYETFKTRKSYNTPVGLSVEILNAKPDTDFYIFEFGVNKKGDMDDLLKIVSPTKAVITNIGYAHIGSFGTREEILREKIKLAHAETVGEVYINSNTDYFDEIVSLMSDYNARIYSSGKRPDDDLIYEILGVDQLGYATVRFTYRLKKFEFKMSVPGVHNVENLALAFLIAVKSSVEPDELIKASAELRLPKMRLEIISKGGFTFINDAYNSNPSSLKAALEYLFIFARDSDKKKVAVLGDMLELGEMSEYFHEQAGEQARKMGVDLVIYIGEFGGSFLKGYADEGRFYIAETHEEAARILKDKVEGEAVVLLKASRALALERVLEYV
jgi:UDP-N-acetylmuramoyl-tripeptide--D-alanyl-D-alanine ligase